MTDDVGIRTKYQQIADEVRAKIRSGEYVVGQQLPTKAALAEEHGVALKTLDRALEILREQGWVKSLQGVGIFARLPAQDESADSEPDNDRFTQMEARVARLEAQMENVQANLGIPQARTGTRKNTAAG